MSSDVMGDAIINSRWLLSIPVQLRRESLNVGDKIFFCKDANGKIYLRIVPEKEYTSFIAEAFKKKDGIK